MLVKISPSARIQFADRLFSECLDTMRAKMHDYASADNANTNLSACEALGIATTSQGILTRMLDKISRASQVIHHGAAVPETVRETLKDLINYSVILAQQVEGESQ